MKEELNLSIEDHKNATIEISFLLNIFTKIISDRKRAFNSLGISSGREFAKKMPVMFDSNDMKATIDQLIYYLKGGFDISSELSEKQINFKISRCALKNICKLNSNELGNDLCKLFHFYMNGMIIEITRKKFRMSIHETGEVCTIKHTMI